MDLDSVSSVVRRQFPQDFVLRGATVLRGHHFIMENASHQLHVHVSSMEKSFQMVQKLDRTVINGTIKCASMFVFGSTYLF